MFQGGRGCKGVRGEAIPHVQQTIWERASQEIIAGSWQLIDKLVRMVFSPLPPSPMQRHRRCRTRRKHTKKLAGPGMDRSL